MVNLKSRIQKLKSSRSDSEEARCMIAYIYKKTFGLTHKELMREPIPVVMSNIRMMAEENKKRRKPKKV